MAAEEDVTVPSGEHLGDEGDAEEETEAAIPIPFRSLSTLNPSQTEVGICEKLVSSGVCTVEALSRLTKREFSELGDGALFASTDALICLQKRAKSLVPTGFKTALSLQEENETHMYLQPIPFGIPTFDAVIGGGVRPAEITELYGESGSGKTQAILCLSISAQLPAAPRPSRTVIIDTEGKVKVQRLRQMARARGLDANQVLENVEIARVYSPDHLLPILQDANRLLYGHGGQCGLLVVDSIIAPLRATMNGRADLVERQNLLGKVLMRLGQIASEFKVAVVVTNQVTTKVDYPGGVFHGSMTLPVGGNIQAHASNLRIKTSNGSGARKRFSVVKSPEFPEKDVLLEVDAAGLKEFGST